MLVLSRKENETIHIGDDIVITLVKIDRNRVRIGITAPVEVKVIRSELAEENSGNTDAHRGMNP
jgi:carbon storage regulator